MEVVYLAESRRTNATFADRVKKAFEVHGLGSTREAAKVTGIGHVTLYRMQHGVVPSIATVKRWALAIKEPESRWLVWAFGGEDSPGDTAMESINGNTEAPETPSSASYSPSPPPEVSEVIRQALKAGDVDGAVEEAFYYVRRPEHRRILNFQAGASGGDTRPGKIAIVRAFEHLAGVELLPKEILF